MRVKKQKRHRKIVRFFTACFGFREPFKILCDGTFVNHLMLNEIVPADTHLSNLLGAQIKMFTTRCVFGELKSLGEEYSETLKAAQNLFVARCDHERRKNARKCIEDIVGTNNSEHFFVATQDADLRRMLDEIPGVPVIYGLRKSLFIEQPSSSQREFVKSTEEQRLHMSKLEFRLLKTREKRRTMEANSSGLDGDSIDQVISRPIVRSRKVSMNSADRVRFKRSKAKGPNPLSCKKKSKMEPSLGLKQNNDESDSTVKKKRTRKRKRSHKENNGETNA